MRRLVFGVTFAALIGCAKIANVPAPGAKRFVTAAVAVPTALAAGSYTDMSFDLSTLGADFAGAVFQVTIRNEAQASLTYGFKEPRLVSPSASLRIADIRVLVNGQESATATAYQEVDLIAAASEAPLLSSLTTTAVGVSASTDQIAFSFGALAKGTPAACKNLTTFVSNVLGTASTPNTLQHNCFGCHASTGSVANGFFNMAALDNASLCARFLQRTAKSKPADSAVLFNPANGFNDMPVIAGDYSAWLTWIQAESN